MEQKPEQLAERVEKLERDLEDHAHNHVLHNPPASTWVSVFRWSTIAFLVIFIVVIAGVQVRTEFFSYSLPFKGFTDLLSVPAIASVLAALVALLNRDQNKRG